MDAVRPSARSLGPLIVIALLLAAVVTSAPAAAGTTRLVKDITPGRSGSGTSKVLAHARYVFFDVYREGDGGWIWRSRGTRPSTIRLAKTGVFNSIVPIGSRRVAWWKWRFRGPGTFGTTDGAPASTVHDAPWVGKSVFVRDHAQLDDAYLFGGRGCDPPWDLCRTDRPRTVARARPVASINAGRAGVAELTTVGDLVYFTASDGTHGRELWVTDGTRAGTRLVADIRPGTSGGGPEALTPVGRRLFFTADDGVHGREPWVTDGTRAGTRLVEDIRPGPEASHPGGLVRVARRIFLNAKDGSHGRELWVSDGTRAGTRLVEDIRRGPKGSSPTALVAVGRRVYFSAGDRTHGRELWRSSGTSRSTRLVADIRPGRRGSKPADLVRLRDIIMFTADTLPYGRELWKHVP